MARTYSGTRRHSPRVPLHAFSSFGRFGFNGRHTSVVVCANFPIFFHRAEIEAAYDKYFDSSSDESSPPSSPVERPAKVPRLRVTILLEFLQGCTGHSLFGRPCRV